MKQLALAYSEASEGFEISFGVDPEREIFWRRKAAETEGLTQEEFNDRMNNPDYYQIEDPHENRSPAHEMPADEQGEEQIEERGQEM